PRDELYDHRRTGHVHRDLHGQRWERDADGEGCVPDHREQRMALWDYISVRSSVDGPVPRRVPDLDGLGVAIQTIAAGMSSMTRSQYRHATRGGSPARTKKSVSTGSLRFVMQFGFPHFRIPTARSGSRT